MNQDQLNHIKNYFKSILATYDETNKTISIFFRVNQYGKMMECLSKLKGSKLIKHSTDKKNNLMDIYKVILKI